MRNSICMLSFPVSHIVFFFKKMYVVLIGLGICFFTKHVHILVKDFKDFNVFCQDFNVFCQDFNVFFTFSKTSMSSLHFKDFNVFCQDFNIFLTFQDFNVLCRYISIFQCLLSYRDFNVFCLYISRLQCLLYISRLQSLLFSTLDTLYIYSFDRFHCFGFC